MCRGLRPSPCFLLPFHPPWRELTSLQNLPLFVHRDIFTPSTTRVDRCSGFRIRNICRWSSAGRPALVRLWGVRTESLKGDLHRASFSLSLFHTHTLSLTAPFFLIRRGLILRASHLANLGLFAGRPLAKGSFVTTYAGELLSTSEARSRWALQKECGREGEGNYVFCLREGGGRWNVDPSRIGGIGCVSFLPFCSPPPYFDAKSIAEIRHG